jgi:DNA-directed RNA polymerase subunit K/omega
MLIEMRHALRPGELAGKFRLVQVVVQRSRQLQDGARPRIYAPGHKLLRVALQEALDGLVSWELMPAAVPARARPER